MKMLMASINVTQDLLCMLGNFSCDDFSKLTFQEILSGTLSVCQTVWSQIRTDIECLSCSGSKLFTKLISRRQMSPLARKEVILKMSIMTAADYTF